MCREVVDSNVSLSSDKEMGFEGMEEGGLDEAFRFAEGGLGVVLAELMNEN